MRPGFLTMTKAGRQIMRLAAPSEPHGMRGLMQGSGHGLSATLSSMQQGQEGGEVLRGGS